MRPTFGEAVAHGLRHVLDFRGRDSRAWFWPYAGAVLASWIALSNAIIIPVMLIQASASSDPVADVGELQGVFLGVTAIFAVLIVVLLAAATTRRLHDRGRRGAWAAVPVILICSGLVIFAILLGSDDEPDPALFAAGFVNNLLYFATLIVLIVQLVQRGKPEGSRFDAS